MKGSVKNIGQKGNENRELYNNNLKVVNHMEKKHQYSSLWFRTGDPAKSVFGNENST